MEIIVYFTTISNEDCTRLSTSVSQVEYILTYCVLHGECALDTVCIEVLEEGIVHHIGELTYLNCAG